MSDQPLGPLAITMGEPAGIGAEILVKAWHHYASGANPIALPFFVIDAPSRYRDYGAPIVSIASPAQAANLFPDALPVLDIGVEVAATLGQLDAKNSAAVIRAIEMAVGLCRRGAASGLITNPIEKKILVDAGFQFAGHTEFLGALTADMPMPGRLRGPVMMLAGPQLRCVPVSVHQSLRSVPDALTSDEIIRVGQITAEALRYEFAIANPRLAIAGLNPHAGEGGLFGDEESRIIVPAITALREHGIDVVGPLPADTMFHAEKRATYDVALCMYHDQALIPVKTLDFHHTVNVTLGLPIVRTSPDHGTALDIAGKGIANPASLIRAIEMASQIVHAKQSQSSV